MPPKPARTPLKIGFFTMVRDIAVESMKKGQFPLAAVFLILLAVLWKTPSDYFPELWRELFKLQGKMLVVSVAGNVILLMGWFWHARRQRRRFQEEFDRVATERTKLQQSQISTPIQSSRRS
jgi:hypothetical protein